MTARPVLSIHAGVAALVTICSLFLAGCETATNPTPPSLAIPVAAITKNGRIMRGTDLVKDTQASISVSDGKTTCTGSYDPAQQTANLTIPVVCTDGRTGIAVATHDTPVSGGGRVTFSDGTEGTSIFGEGAKRI